MSVCFLYHQVIVFKNFVDPGETEQRTSQSIMMVLAAYICCNIFPIRSISAIR